MAKRRQSKGVTIKTAKRIRVTRSKPTARRGATQLNTDLNIILKPQEINAILRGVVGTKGNKASALFG